MRKLILIQFILFFIFACSKGKKIERRIDGGNWKLVSTTQTNYDGNGGSDSRTFLDSTNSKVTFNKDGTCEWFSEKGFYHGIGPAGENGIEGFLDIDVPSDYLHMKVLECTRRNLVVRDEGNFQSAYFTGYALEYKFEKE